MCNILERKQLENLSKTQYIFRFLWILFTWVLKKEWMGLIKILGWEKKQLHVLVLGMVFFKKIATSKFCVCYDLLFAPNSTAWYLLIQNFSLLNLRWLLKGKTCSMIVGMISLKLCPCLLKCSPVGFVRSFCEMYPLCSLNLSQNLRLVSPM